MNNGILERIEAKLDLLLSQRATSADLPSATNISEPTLAETSANNQALAETSTSIEIDKNDTPWDERIHTSNKGKTMRGVWKRKPGLEDEFYNSIIAEITVHTEDADIAEPVIEVPVKKAPPAKPVPVKKAPPAKPVPTKSAETPEDQKYRGQALKLISTITEKFKATFEDVVRELLAPHGVDTFDTLPVEKHAELYEQSNNWLKQLELIQNEVDVLDTASAGSEHIDDINDGIESYISDSGGEGRLLGSVPIANLTTLLTEMTEYADQWDEFFKE